MILEGKTKERTPRSAAFYSPSWSGKVTVVALWTLRTSATNSVPPLLPPSPSHFSETWLWDAGKPAKTQLRDAAPEKNTAANQGKNWARAEPEPSQAQQSKGVVLCLVDDPALWSFTHHCSSLSGAWGWETLGTGAPTILCLSQQLCRNKSKS